MLATRVFLFVFLRVASGGGIGDLLDALEKAGEASRGDDGPSALQAPRNHGVRGPSGVDLDQLFGQAVVDPFEASGGVSLHGSVGIDLGSIFGGRAGNSGQAHGGFGLRGSVGIDLGSMIEEERPRVPAIRPQALSQVPNDIGVGIEFARPVLMNVGPSVDVDFGRDGFPGFPFEELFGMGPMRSGPSLEQEMNGIFSQLESLESSQKAQSGGFHVDKEHGHFRLRASLPGYKMHSKGESEGNQPLSVEVLGQSLVVRGRQTEENMLRSFQRSFRLPKAADSDAIQVTYNVSDGALAVDIPAKPGAHSAEDLEGDADSWTVDSLTDGSQTTIMFSSGGGGHGLHNGIDQLFPPMPPFMQSLVGMDNGDMAPRPPRKQPKFLEASSRQSSSGPSDPLSQFLNGITGADEGHEQKPQAAGIDSAPVAEEVRLIDGRQYTHRQCCDHFGEEAESKWAEAQAPPSLASQKPAQKPAPLPAQKPAPLVVQPKDAKPFWRLASDNGGIVKQIEVVLPDGTEAGHPEGQNVPIFKSAKVDGNEPERIGKVELPVSVRDEDCQHIQKGASSTEQLLRCRIEGDSVKKVPIHIIDEL